MLLQVLVHLVAGNIDRMSVMADRALWNRAATEVLRQNRVRRRSEEKTKRNDGKQRSEEFSGD